MCPHFIAVNLLCIRADAELRHGEIRHVRVAILVGPTSIVKIGD